MSDDTIALPRLYMPLEDHEFRVLILSPSEDKASQLIAHFETQHLGHDIPAYEAVSYVSGADEGGSILIRHVKLSISWDLREILVRLRHTHHERRLWVDFICVDTDNRWELIRQAQYMSLIYTKASAVLVCLSEKGTRMKPGRAMVIRPIIGKSGSPRPFDKSAKMRFRGFWLSRVWRWRKWRVTPPVQLLRSRADLLWEELKTGGSLHVATINFTIEKGLDGYYGKDIMTILQFARFRSKGRKSAEESLIQRLILALTQRGNDQPGSNSLAIPPCGKGVETGKRNRRRKERHVPESRLKRHLPLPVTVSQQVYSGASVADNLPQTAIEVLGNTGYQQASARTKVPMADGVDMQGFRMSWICVSCTLNLPLFNPCEAVLPTSAVIYYLDDVMCHIYGAFRTINILSRHVVIRALITISNTNQAKCRNWQVALKTSVFKSCSSGGIQYDPLTPM
ncbi:hypothetical protein T440DRAFT_209543 [Plenodomus tracheiphilus IPT5]|uniref:Heterokaryon incompatibility domain-containing protein n=1 Tax=Plenodomus tracheiphilus IPT5 TaxID=1408161 RepID=A0A6A7BME3_9PLEO|nr:hypothetical protein T440DRAFT_209543 [Plenodomus tracheiphilus IPT5]